MYSYKRKSQTLKLLNYETNKLQENKLLLVFLVQ